MEMELLRYGSTPVGTFGKLTCGEHSWITLERPWEDNKRGVSCIPSGRYHLEPHTRPGMHNVRDVYALVNKELGITHFEEPGTKRDLILIHPANIYTQLAGCIALGTKYFAMDGKWAVGNSTNAVKELMSILAEKPFEEHMIDIYWQVAEENEYEQVEFP